MKIKLLDYSNDIERGTIIRCKAKYPYEDVVDFLVSESYDADTGYVDGCYRLKGGLTIYCTV